MRIRKVGLNRSLYFVFYKQNCWIKDLTTFKSIPATKFITRNIVSLYQFSCLQAQIHLVLCFCAMFPKLVWYLNTFPCFLSLLFWAKPVKCPGMLAEVLLLSFLQAASTSLSLSLLYYSALKTLSVLCLFHLLGQILCLFERLKY